MSAESEFELLAAKFSEAIQCYQIYMILRQHRSVLHHHEGFWASVQRMSLFLFTICIGSICDKDKTHEDQVTLYHFISETLGLDHNEVLSDLTKDHIATIRALDHYRNKVINHIDTDWDVSGPAIHVEDTMSLMKCLRDVFLWLDDNHMKLNLYFQPIDEVSGVGANDALLSLIQMVARDEDNE